MRKIFRITKNVLTFGLTESIMNIKSQVLKQNRHSPYKYWFVAISLYSVTENISGKLKKILVMQDSLDLLACTVSVIQFHVKNLSHVFQYFIIISKLVSVCTHWDTAVFF